VSTYVFDRITIIGLGLIGSSIARAARKNQVVKTIVGCDLSEISLAYAQKHSFIDTANSNLQEAVRGSQLVIIATPPSTLEDIAKTMAPHLQEGAIVMDVCSVKLAAIAAIEPHIPAGVHFIPAHPIAGSEHSGVSAGRADLFEKKRVVVTPTDPKQDYTMQNVTSFWKGLGARCEAMPAALHDLIYAYVSHLPQLLAFAASASIEPLDDLARANDLLQKFLRISASDPDLWIDIFILNRDNILKALDAYLDAVSHIISEFDQAPQDEIATPADERLARCALFPRVAASCLITTVMHAEKKAGFSFARYAGTGFADFTCPASQAPEGDIESISNQYKEVVAILKEYTERLKSFRKAINSGEDLFPLPPGEG